MTYTWEIVRVDRLNLSVLVKYLTEDGSDVTINIPMPTKDADVNEHIRAFSPFRELPDMSAYATVRVGDTGSSVTGMT
jgi:hypothetical protein